MNQTWGGMPHPRRADWRQPNQLDKADYVEQRCDGRVDQSETHQSVTQF